MLFVKFKCPKCGAIFKMLRLLARPDSTRDCPSCGNPDVSLTQEDIEQLRIEDQRCSSFG